jgi:uncharacterized protein YecA (UPF0149 family)
MNERWVKKEEVEKQLYEIFQLMQQIDEKMEKVIDDMIEERYEQQQAQLDQLGEQVGKVEQRLNDETEKAFQQTLPLPANVPSKLHFV